VPLSPADKTKIQHWQQALVALGALLLLLVIVLEFFSSISNTKVTEDKTTPNKTVTTTDGVAIPGSLVTTTLAGAVLLFVGGAFYGRITKFTWGDLVVELSAPAATAVEEKAKAVAATAQASPAKAKELTDLSKWIAGHANFAVSLAPHDLADVAVDAARRQLNLA
jgi:hypothetical protein